MKERRYPVHFTTAEGKKRVRVPLAKNRGEAVFDHADYVALIAAGYSDQMTLNRAGVKEFAYVRSHLSQRGLRTLARPILGARRGQHIHYRDGDRLNLTRENLELAERGAGINPDCLLCTRKASPAS